MEIAEKCEILTEQQWRALGADQPPDEQEANGKLGCQYGAGEALHDSSVFVATDPSRTLQDFSEMSMDPLKPLDLSGYPAGQSSSDNGKRHCMTAVDISDEGSLWVNFLLYHSQVDACEMSAEFAKVALENLDDAPGGK